MRLAAGSDDSQLSRAPWLRYSSRQRWGFLAILFLVATANYFDFFVLAILLEPIKAEFHVSDTMLGILSGVCFALVYSAAALPTARWADLGNRRTVITCALVGWSVMTAACGFARTFWQLALARFGVGAFEPGALPAAQSLITDYFPPERRATALAILANGGSATGWLLGIGAGGYLAATRGWRTAFLLAGLLSLMLAVLTHFVLAEPRKAYDSSEKRGPLESMLVTTSWLLRKRSFVWSLCGFSMYATFAYGVMVFVPSFLVRSFHASLEQVSIIWGCIIATANLGGAIIGGILADRLSRRDIRWYAWVPAIGCALGLPLYVLALCAKQLWTFIGIEFCAELMISIGVPVIYAAALAVSGSSRRAVASAAMISSTVLVGGNIGPLWVGVVSDAMSSTRGVDSLRYSLLSVLIFLIPAIVAFYWAGRAMPQDLEP